MPSTDVVFHFAQPGWLELLPVPFLLYWWRGGAGEDWARRYRAYADPHLLPHLITLENDARRGTWRRWGRWIALWTLAVVAMAGPRWNFHTVEIFTPASDVVVLLDLSRSMATQDVQPSRMVRARQEIEDFLATDPHARVGLVAFATVAFVAAPLTEDYHTIRRLLPAMTTDLPQFHGSRLSEALDRAEAMLADRHGSKAMLLVSDGDFAEPELEARVRQLRKQGIRLHVLGIGTVGGGPVPGGAGRTLRDRHGKPVISPLAEGQLRQLARAGEGLYLRADFREQDTRQLRERLQRDAPPMPERNPIKIWQERFYVPVLMMLAILLHGFRQRRMALVE